MKKVLVSFSLLFLALLLAGCPGGFRPPSTASETFSLAYTEMNSAYDLLDELNTPTVPGAKPLVDNERAVSVYKQLVQANNVLDQANAAYMAGQPYTDKLQSWRQMLLVIRAALPKEN